jgi:hypothetical protein
MEKILVSMTLANLIMFCGALYVEFRTPQAEDQAELEELTVNESHWTVTYLNSTDDADRSHYAHMHSRRIMCEY